MDMIKCFPCKWFLASRTQCTWAKHHWESRKNRDGGPVRTPHAVSIYRIKNCSHYEKF